MESLFGAVLPPGLLSSVDLDVPGQAQINYAWDDGDRLLTITPDSNMVTFD